MTGVSFVVPVHNGAAHLAETIASIVAQGDGRPMEIIVVEDASRLHVPDNDAPRGVCRGKHEGGCAMCVARVLEGRKGGAGDVGAVPLRR